MMRLSVNPGGVGGRILEKRSSSSLSSASSSPSRRISRSSIPVDDDKDDLQISNCLVAIDIDPSRDLQHLLWYGFNPNGILNKKKKKKKIRKSGHGDDGGKLLRFRDLTPGLESESISNKPPPIIVALGSCVYLIGRVPKGEGEGEEVVEDEKEKEKEEARQVYYFDTTCPLNGWVRGPDMINPRGNAVRVVAVQGKLYVFGGNVNDDDCTITITNTTRKKMKKEYARFAEVLDPIKNKWEALPPPPKQAYRDFQEWSKYYESSTRIDLKLPPVAYDCEGTNIFVGASSYIYCVDTQTWKQLPLQLYDIMKHISDNLVGVGNSLYWTLDGRLYALNMETGELDSTLIEGYCPITCLCCHFGFDQSILLHRGGNKFWSITADTLVPLPGGSVCTKVRFSKLRVSKGDGSSIRASIVSYEVYLIDHMLFFSQALALEGLLLGEKNEEGSAPKKLRSEVAQEYYMRHL